jgi:hypothetical protein
MLELKAVESRQARGPKVDARTQYYVFPEGEVSIRPGEEFLLVIGDPNDPARERYGFAVRISANSEPEEDEMMIQYGDKVFVAQKLPEFI